MKMSFLYLLNFFRQKYELTPLIQWAFRNKDKIQLSVSEIEKTPFHLDGYSDYEVTLNYLDHVATGRKASRSAIQALEIALSEAIERAVFHEGLFYTTNGMAAYPNVDGARLHAKQELIERDLFLCHYLTMTPFYPYPFQHPLVGDLWKLGIEMSFHRTASWNNCSCVVAIASGEKFKRPFSYIIGSGASANLSDAASKAILEAALNVIHVIEDKTSTAISLGDFLSIEMPGVEDQLRMAMSFDVREGIKPLLQYRTDKVIPNVSAENDAFEFQVLHQPDVEQSRAPLYVVRCFNRDLQKLFFGKTTNDKVNFERLQHFCDKVGTKFERLNPYPHMMA